MARLLCGGCLAVSAAVTGAVGCSSVAPILLNKPQGPSLVDDRPGPAVTTTITLATTTTAESAPPPDPSRVERATTTSAVTVPEPPPTREWTLLAGGDVLMDRTEAAGIDPFEFIEPPLASADLAVVNSEMAISDRGTAVDKTYVFRAAPSAAHTMASTGVDVANLANNHARDFGAAALLDTVELLEAAGVIALGAGIDDDAAFRHRLVDIGEAATVAVVGVSMIVPLNFTAATDYPGIASRWDTARVLDSVRSADRDADVVVAAVHWGIERDPCPSADQRSFARALLDAGADVVIGHHPHVLQPIEFVDGSLIAYSLGNFVWHPRSGITGETGALQIDFDADRIVGWTFHPHLLDDNGAPRPAEAGPRLDRILAIIQGDCEPHRPPPPTTTTTTTETRTGANDDTPEPAATETPKLDTQDLEPPPPADPEPTNSRGLEAVQ